MSEEDICKICGEKYTPGEDWADPIVMFLTGLFAWKMVFGDSEPFLELCGNCNWEMKLLIFMSPKGFYKPLLIFVCGAFIFAILYKLFELII